jgi:hypothetical protein
MSFPRRDFLKGSLASLGLAAFAGGRAFAAPEGWKHPKKPNLVFGVLSDTHFRTDAGWRKGSKSDRFFVSALDYFRSQNVDAVMHCGDMADRGLVEELQLHADAWYRVFPQNKAPDGHVVEKLFVSGNHDIDSWRKDIDMARFIPNREEWPEKIIKMDPAGHWKRIWGETYEPVWHKTVKGYHFFGQNWIENGHGEGDAAFMARIDSEMGTVAHRQNNAVKPFFFVSHDRRHGKFTREIGRHPGGFGFWGHWHFSASNWHVVQMLNALTAGIQCPACPSWWRPDGKWMGGGDKKVSRVPIEGKLQGGKWYQGLVVRVYDDLMTIEPREFSTGGRLGAHWVLPFDWNQGTGTKGTAVRPHPFARGELKKAIGEPQFRPGAKLEVELVKRVDGGEMNQSTLPLKRTTSGVWRVKIPPADGNPHSRVYAYELAVTGKGRARQLVKAVYAAGCHLGVGHEPNGGVTTLVIPGAELPPGKSLAFEVRPLTSLGTSGRPLRKKIVI